MHLIREVSVGGVFSDPAWPHYSNLPVVHPLVVEGYDAAVQSNNVVHQILGAREPSVTFRPAGLRTGKLTLHFTDTREAMRAEQVHIYGQVLSLQIDADEWSLPESINMFYVVDGTIARTRSGTRSWIVTVDFQEVRGPLMNRIW